MRLTQRDDKMDTLATQIMYSLQRGEVQAVVAIINTTLTRRTQGGGQRHRMVNHGKGPMLSEEKGLDKTQGGSSSVPAAIRGNLTRKLWEKWRVQLQRIRLRHIACPNHVALRFASEDDVVEVEWPLSGLTTLTGQCG
jgi:hypothetical protein